jgi:dTDP-4-dehydrorhamnose reductase
MKILEVGASGAIGSAVVNELSKRHEIINVGKKSGDLTCDITDSTGLKHKGTKTLRHKEVYRMPFIIRETPSFT